MFDSQAETKEQFKVLVDYVIRTIGQEIGITLNDKSISMVESRLQSRLIQLRMNHPDEYFVYLENNWQSEFDELVALLTTHHTFFYREPIHFEILERELPRLVSEIRSRGGRRLRVLCAACSYGQEAYSLAMVLYHQLAALGNPIDFEILGIDVDKMSVNRAREGIYKKTDLDQTPLVYIKNHWAPGRGAVANLVKAKKSLRERCRFRQVNLLKLENDRFLGQFDIVFCRNVFIYFQSAQIEKTVTELKKHLDIGGLLITGLSEPLDYQKLGLKSMGSTAYLNLGEPAELTSPPQKATAVPLPQVTKPIRVFAIDDSKTVLKILEKIVRGSNDLEWAGSALSAKEAIETLKTVETDVVTLDIHMPEMDGITFLEKHHNCRKTPVVMISSARRDDAKLALKALELGASDFVEKPTIHNLNSKADEIVTKIKASQRGQKRDSISYLSYDRKHSRAQKFDDLDEKIIIFTASLMSKEKVLKELRKFSRPHPPIMILIDDGGFVIPEIIADWETRLSQEMVKWTPRNKPQPNQICIASLEDFTKYPSREISPWQKAIAIYDGVPDASARKLRGLRNCFYLLEEYDNKADETRPPFAQSEVVPATSFAYLASEVLNKKAA